MKQTVASHSVDDIEIGPAVDLTSIADNNLWVTNSSAKRRWPSRLRELAATKELAFFFAARDLKLRYRQTFFGVAWAVIQPVAQAVIALFIFGRLLNAPSDGVAYILFAYTGFVGWTYIQRSFTAASDSLVANPDLLAKIFFPRLHAPLGSVLPALVDLAVGMVLLVPLLAYYDQWPSWRVLTTPLWALALVLCALAPGVLLAAVNINYRDVKHMIPFASQLWFYLTPIAYSSTIVPETWLPLYRLNPATTALDGLRWALLGTPFPSYSWISALSGLALLALALTTFVRLEKSFADVI